MQFSETTLAKELQNCQVTMHIVVIGISCDSSADFPTVNQIQQPWDSSGWNQS